MPVLLESKDSEAWNRNPGSYKRRLAIDGSFREMVNKYAL